MFIMFTLWTFCTSTNGACKYFVHELHNYYNIMILITTNVFNMSEMYKKIYIDYNGIVQPVME